MASKLTAPSSSSFLLHPTPHFHVAKPISSLWIPGSRVVAWPGSRRRRRTRAATIRECVVKGKAAGSGVVEEGGVGWGKVSAVLFDMDGVLCNSEEPSRMAAVDLFLEMGVPVSVEDFVPFTGMGEANFLGGVAKAKGVKDFSVDEAKKRFFEIYLDKYAQPGSGIGFPGALELIMQCKSKGLKVAVASSADRIKVDANLAAAGLPISMFDAVVSADAFENLKPAPDIFLSASKLLDVPTSECLVIEDALAGVQAANAAQMRCIAVTTTMSEESLKNAGPSFIRSNTGNITLDDILYGGSSGDNEKMQGSQAIHSSTKNLETIVEENAENGSILKNSVPKDGAFSIREQCNMHPLKLCGTC